MKVARGFAFRLASELSTKLLAVGVTVWMTRSLGPEAWGQMQWALALAALAAALADFGLGSLTLREISRAAAADRPAWIRAAWTLKALLWALVLLVFGLAMAFRPEDEHGLLVCALAYTGMLSACELTSFFFVGVERLDIDFYVSLAGKLLQALAAVTALALGMGAPGVLLCMAVAGFGGWFWGLSRLGALEAVPSRARDWKKKAASLWAGLWPFGLAPVLALAAGKADSVLIRHYLDDASVGIYQSAYKWLEAIGFVPVALVIAFYPKLARSAGKKNGEKDAQTALALLATLAALSVAFLWALASELPLILGEKFEAAKPLLRILSISCLATFLNYVLGNLLVIHRRQDRVLVGLGLGLAFNLGFNVWLLPRYGCAAAAWNTVGTECLVGIAGLYYLRGIHSALPVLALVVRSSLAAGAGAGVAIALQGGPIARASALLLAPGASLLLAMATGILSKDSFTKIREAVASKGA